MATLLKVLNNLPIPNRRGVLHFASELRQGDRGYAMTQVRDQLLAKMPPGYEAAHAQYAWSIQRAFDAGHNIFSSKVTANQHQAMLNGMTAPERQAYNAGA